MLIAAPIKIASSVENSLLVAAYANAVTNVSTSFWFDPCSFNTPSAAKNVMVCSVFGAYVYDDVFSFGISIEAAIKNGEDPKNVTVLRKYRQNIDFPGSTLTRYAHDSFQVFQI